MQKAGKVSPPGQNCYFVIPDLIRDDGLAALHLRDVDLEAGAH